MSDILTLKILNVLIQVLNIILKSDIIICHGLILKLRSRLLLVIPCNILLRFILIA